MATWKYEEECGDIEDFKYRIVAEWNTTSDIGCFYKYPDHMDEEKRKESGMLFGRDSIDQMIKILQKMKEDHCY